MYITEVSIKRPVVAWVMSLILIIFGIFVFLELPVRELPDGIQPPVVQVQTDYKSASAEIVDEEITQKLEDVIGGAEGIKNIDSSSLNGRSRINIQFNTDIDLDDAATKITNNCALVAFSHVSNGLGCINPAEQIIGLAKSVGALTLVDGAQAALHLTVDVQALDCDFYVFSGHKIFAPTGIGVLYGRYQLLERLPPWQGGGEMIEHVTLEHSTYQAPPYKYEAGTPNIAGAIGLGAALRYLREIPRPDLVAQEDKLVASALSGLQQIPGVRLIGEPKKRSAVISFLLDQGHPADVGTLLDQQGVAVRTGHHCNMPLMQRLGVPGTVRASFSLYNNQDDVERLLKAVDKATTFL